MREAAPSREDLAKCVGVSRFHFHCLFRQGTGLTPRQCAAARRENKVRNEFGQGGTSSRFYEKSS
ncbi:hypothetical protein EBAPG3_007875 [Nitrosospira lacus]|uniref:HTH araC/xylS-type domain-containing protein n=1 Tax=Nitrosospira lacus TaxID=1288494 RepID=A0A1W6SPH8_9PROT|nr:hypothetical protein EBAPG3_007875 [Nitrosospira lacus]